MIIERRTVLTGFLLLLSSFLLGMFLLSRAMGDPAWFSDHFLFHILLDIELIFIAALLIAYPLVLVPVFLIGGVVLMRKEGLRPRNVLSAVRVMASMLREFGGIVSGFTPLNDS